MSYEKSGQPKLTPRKSKGSVTQTYEFPYMINQKDERTLAQMIYDGKNGKFLGRDAKSWGQLMFFYTIFYIVLGALFAICMKGLLMTCNTQSPKWTLHESIIGTNPGLGFRPISDDVEQGSLIWYDASNQTQIKYWTRLLDDFMADYRVGSSNQKACDFDTFRNHSQVCKLDLSKFDQCTHEHAYGFNNSSPCFFLKLNRIYDWHPEFYNNPEDLPADMPQDLKDHITELPESHRDQVWVSCVGEYGADKEMIGDIEYYPTRGFPSYFYPYVNTPGYLSPLVAVKFLRPRPNQIINIECRAWAKNIVYSGSYRDRKGSVHFELMIDAPIK